MADLDSFRRETREWLRANAPKSMATPLGDHEEPCWGGRKAPYDNREAKQWLEVMAARGWTAPTWPKEYGGGGLSTREARVLAQEMAALRLRPPLVGFGLSMIGPTLLQVRQRGAEARAPAADRARRDPLVPGLLRARLRLGSRQPADARRASTATTSSSPARRSGPRTPTRPTGCSCSCAPTPPRRSRRGSRSC